jgi:hypothetical protein
MFEAVRQTALRAADTVVLDPQVVDRWATGARDRDRDSVPTVDGIVGQFVSTIDNAYTRRRRERMRLWGWAALVAFTVACLMNLLIPDSGLRESIVGPIGLVSVVLLAVWLVLRAKATDRTPSETATIRQVQSQLTAAGKHAFYDRLRERRHQLLQRLDLEPDRSPE